MDKLGFDLDDGSSASPAAGDNKHANPQEAKKLSIQIQRCIQSLEHACQCKDAKCRLPSCNKMKCVVAHQKVCKRKTNGGCPICKQLTALCCYHTKHCMEIKCPLCPVPFCANIKHKLRQQQAHQRVQQNQLLMQMGGGEFTTLSTTTTSTPTASQQVSKPQTGTTKMPGTTTPHVSFGDESGSSPLAALQTARQVQEEVAEQQAHMNMSPIPGTQNQFSVIMQTTNQVQQPNQQQQNQGIGGIRNPGRPIGPQQQGGQVFLHQLLQTLRSPTTPEQQQQTLQILKSNPQLMTAFIRHRQQLQAQQQPQQQPLQHQGGISQQNVQMGHEQQQGIQQQLVGINIPTSASNNFIFPNPNQSNPLTPLPFQPQEKSSPSSPLLLHHHHPIVLEVAILRLQLLPLLKLLLLHRNRQQLQVPVLAPNQAPNHQTKIIIHQRYKSNVSGVVNQKSGPHLQNQQLRI